MKVSDELLLPRIIYFNYLKTLHFLLVEDDSSNAVNFFPTYWHFVISCKFRFVVSRKFSLFFDRSFVAMGLKRNKSQGLIMQSLALKTHACQQWYYAFFWAYKSLFPNKLGLF